MRCRSCLGAASARSCPHYLHAVACLGNGLVHVCGEASKVTGATLSSSKYGVTVSPECSAVEFAWFIGAVVLSFPAPWRARMLGLLGGVVFVALLNSLRVASLFLVGVHARMAFDLVHEDVWAVLLIIEDDDFYRWMDRVDRCPIRVRVEGESCFGVRASEQFRVAFRPVLQPAGLGRLAGSLRKRTLRLRSRGLLTAAGDSALPANRCESGSRVRATA